MDPFVVTGGAPSFIPSEGPSQRSVSISSSLSKIFVTCSHECENFVPLAPPSTPRTPSGSVHVLLFKPFQGADLSIQSRGIACDPQGKKNPSAPLTLHAEGALSHTVPSAKGYSAPQFFGTTTKSTLTSRSYAVIPTISQKSTEVSSLFKTADVLKK